MYAVKGKTWWACIGTLTHSQRRCIFLKIAVDENNTEILWYVILSVMCEIISTDFVGYCIIESEWT